MVLRTTLVLGALVAGTVAGATVQRAVFSTEISEETCAARKPATTFATTDRQVFFSFTLSGVAAGQEVRIDWVDPNGSVQQSAPYTDLPTGSFCIISQLPVSGFPAAGMPGNWAVRVYAADREISSKAFRIDGGSNTDPLRITSVSRKGDAAGSSEQLVLDGAGFEGTSVVHIAEYKKDGGWKYIQVLLPVSGSTNRLAVNVPALTPGEYLAIVRNPDGATSKPAPFIVATTGNYKLPLAGGERWLITQGPYGTYSHWHNSLHAYDIAPRSAVWVTAMRGGTVYAHDLGLHQDHAHRTFGNYVTIQHENGEFSHYAHLATGTFVVKTGDRVEAGQPLAHVGNSGYTFGEGGGYHVHVHVTKTQPISSQSIPFKFEELADVAVTRVRGMEVVGTAPRVGANVIRASLPATGQGGATATAAYGANWKTLSGSVAVAGSWTDVVTVSAGSKTLEADLTWDGYDRDLDIHLVSPSGHHYGWYGDQTGYSGQKSNPERWRIENPEPGYWRVMVAGMSGPGQTAFQVHYTTGAPAPAVRRATVRGRVRRQNGNT